MPVAILGRLIIWLILAVIVIAIVVYFVNWLYRRSSKGSPSCAQVCSAKKW